MFKDYVIFKMDRLLILVFILWFLCDFHHPQRFCPRIGGLVDDDGMGFGIAFHKAVTVSESTFTSNACSEVLRFLTFSLWVPPSIRAVSSSCCLPPEYPLELPHPGSIIAATSRADKRIKKCRFIVV